MFPILSSGFSDECAQNLRNTRDTSLEKREWRKCFFDLLLYFTRFWGIFTSIEKIQKELLIYSLLILAPILGISIPALCLLINEIPTETIIELLSDFTKFQRPSQVDKIEHLVKSICNYIMYLLFAIVVFHIFCGIQIFRGCVRDNNEELCNIFIAPYLFMHFKGFYLYKIGLLAVISISISVCIMTSCIIVIYVVFCVELLSCRFNHLSKLIHDINALECEHEIRIKFGHIMEHYLYNIRIINLVNEMCKNMTVFFIIFSSCALASLGYLVYTSEIMMLKIANIFNLFFWTCNLFLLYSTSQRLTNEHASLGLAFYSIPWYKEEFYPISKYIVICIMKSQKDIGWKSPLFGIMNMNIFGDMLRKAYSLIIILFRLIIGTGVDIVYHHRRTGYYFIGGGVTLFFLETTWVVGVFLKVCIRNEHHRIFLCWRVVRWFDTWPRTLFYCPAGALPLLFHHRLWVAYVAGGQLIALGLLYGLLAFRTRCDRDGRTERLLHPDMDSYESSRFEEVTEVLDDNGGLPEPMPGSSHSLSDSLVEHVDTILEI